MLLITFFLISVEKKILNIKQSIGKNIKCIILLIISNSITNVYLTLDKGF